jgi:hypothetical protein
LELIERQTDKELYAVLEYRKGLPKCHHALLLITFDSGGIGNAPMCREGLSGPERAHFCGGFVTNGNDKIHRRRSRHREFQYLLRRLSVEKPRRFSKTSAKGFTRPARWLPALKPWKEVAPIPSG